MKDKDLESALTLLGAFCGLLANTKPLHLTTKLAVSGFALCPWKSCANTYTHTHKHTHSCEQEKAKERDRRWEKRKSTLKQS